MALGSCSSISAAGGLGGLGDPPGINGLDGLPIFLESGATITPNAAASGLILH